MSPLTQLKIVVLIYKYWLRDLIIHYIRKDISYENLLKFTDYIIFYNEDRKDGDQCSERL